MSIQLCNGLIGSLLTYIRLLFLLRLMHSQDLIWVIYTCICTYVSKGVLGCFIRWRFCQYLDYLTGLLFSVSSVLYCCLFPKKVLALQEVLWSPFMLDYPLFHMFLLSSFCRLYRHLHTILKLIIFQWLPSYQTGKQIFALGRYFGTYPNFPNI